MMATWPPFVAVVICTWNRATLLRQTLTSLSALASPGVPWELLVVDNDSTDATQAVIHDFTGLLPLRSVVERTPGLSHARNRGVRETTAPYILFTDDDVLVDPGWLRGFVDAVRRDPAAAVIGGPIVPWFPVEPPEDLLAAFPELRRGFCGLDHQRDEGPLPAEATVWGANMGFRRTAIGERRFDLSLGVRQETPGFGEELELIEGLRARGGQVLWVPAMVVHHYVSPNRMTLKYLTRYRAELGSEFVRVHGRPRGRMAFGAPLWLWARVFGSFLRYVAYRAVHRQREALINLRDHYHTRGMILETRRRVSDAYGR